MLGSTCLVTSSSGEAKGRHDYLPFGEELGTAHGLRGTPGLGYTADAVRQKFTQKERDSETGLDYFINRYYSSMQGRFTSPDAPFADQWEEEPQSWNLYSYVGNQPLTHTDPFGLWKEVECTSGKGQCWQAEKGDTITSLAKILNVSAEQLNTFFQNPQNIQIGQEFDISGFWSWRAGITTEPAVVFIDLIDESEIPGDKYSIDITIGAKIPNS